VLVRVRPARASSNRRASNGAVRPDNRLAYVDQGFFAGQSAAGQKEVMQVVWVYEHAIDFDGLRRFHHNFSRGLFGRLIERSPLPFARHRLASRRPSPDGRLDRRQPGDFPLPARRPRAYRRAS